MTADGQLVEDGRAAETSSSEEEESHYSLIRQPDGSSEQGHRYSERPSCCQKK